MTSPTAGSLVAGLSAPSPFASGVQSALNAATFGLVGTPTFGSSYGTTAAGLAGNALGLAGVNVPTGVGYGMNVLGAGLGGAIGQSVTNANPDVQAALLGGLPYSSLVASQPLAPTTQAGLPAALAGLPGFSTVNTIGSLLGFGVPGQTPAQMAGLVNVDLGLAGLTPADALAATMTAPNPTPETSLAVANALTAQESAAALSAGPRGAQGSPALTSTFDPSAGAGLTAGGVAGIVGSSAPVATTGPYAGLEGGTYGGFGTGGLGMPGVYSGGAVQTGLGVEGAPAPAATSDAAAAASAADAATGGTTAGLGEASDAGVAAGAGGGGGGGGK